MQRKREERNVSDEAKRVNIIALAPVGGFTICFRTVKHCRPFVFRARAMGSGYSLFFPPFFLDGMRWDEEMYSSLLGYLCSLLRGYILLSAGSIPSQETLPSQCLSPSKFSLVFSSLILSCCSVPLLLPQSRKI
jgi:hypothetical protein